MKYTDTLVIPRSVIEQIFDMESGLKVVEEAFRQHGLGKARMPSKIYLDIPEYNGDFRAMPAFIPDLKAAGLKWVNSHADNPERGYPTVMAVLVLNDPETAWPLAIMDATYITMMRTGAGGGVAAKYLARKDSEVVALVGCGVQAESQLDALQRVLDFKKVTLYDPHEAAIKTLTNMFKGASYEFVVTGSVEVKKSRFYANHDHKHVGRLPGHRCVFGCGACAASIGVVARGQPRARCVGV